MSKTIYANISDKLHSDLNILSMIKKKKLKTLVEEALEKYIIQELKEMNGNKEYGDVADALLDLIENRKKQEVNEINNKEKIKIKKEQQKEENVKYKKREKVRKANLEAIEQLEGRKNLKQWDLDLLEGLKRRCSVCKKENFPRDKCICKKDDTTEERQQS